MAGFTLSVRCFFFKYFGYFDQQATKISEKIKQKKKQKSIKTYKIKQMKKKHTQKKVK